jgi:hypothetical protein
MNVRLKTGRYWVKLIFLELASRYHFCELSDVYRSVNFDSKYLNSRRSHSGTTVAYARVCISGQQFNPEILSGGEKSEDSDQRQRYRHKPKFASKSTD